MVQDMIGSAKSLEAGNGETWMWSYESPFGPFGPFVDRFTTFLLVSNAAVLLRLGRNADGTL